MILDSQAAAKASTHASHRDGESPDPQPLSLGQQHAKKPHSSLHPVPWGTIQTFVNALKYELQRQNIFPIMFRALLKPLLNKRQVH